MKRLPRRRPLTNIDIIRFAKNIPNFRGVFMRNALPSTPNVIECAVVNLDSKDGPGTHWIAYHKNGSNVLYFDSFGNLKPPVELVRYFGRECAIVYNHDQYQRYNTINCGQLCLRFLYNQFYV